MKKLYLDDVMKLLKEQIGYKESGTNITKYAKFFDTTAWQYFNTKKQGSEWCSELLHWVIYKCSDKERCLKFWNEPAPKNNCGAGVKFVYEYMKKLEVKLSDIKKGDIVIFKTSAGKYAHIGMCVSVDDKIHTIEGNKSNQVKECSYSKKSTSISAVIRPTYDKKAAASSGSSGSGSTSKPSPAKKFNKNFNKLYTLTKDGILKQDPKDKSGTSLKRGSKVRCYGYYTDHYLYVTSGSKEGYVDSSILR